MTSMPFSGAKRWRHLVKPQWFPRLVGFAVSLLRLQPDCLVGEGDDKSGLSTSLVVHTRPTYIRDHCVIKVRSPDMVW